MYLNDHAIDWAMHVQIHSAMAQVPKENPNHCNPISNSQSRKIVYDSTSVHAGMNPLISRVETNLAYAHPKNKIRQT
jgi:hypothetical protein